MSARWASVIAAVVAAGLGAQGARTQPAAPPGMMPPEVARIYEKVKRGEKPTPAELETMKQWAASMRGAAPGGARPGGAGAGGPARPGGPGGGPHAGNGQGGPMGMITGEGRFAPPEPPTLERMGVCATKPTKLPAAAPSAREYGTLARAIATRYRKKVAAHAVKLDGELAKATGAGAASAVTVAALSRGNGKAAIYLAARAAAALPDDALLASNLGALLADAGDLADAQRVLLRADALAPDKPLVLANRGWVLHRAKSKDARAMFERALALQPDLAPALLGAGIVAACAGDEAAAAPKLRAAAVRQPNVTAELALQAVAPAEPGPYVGRTKLALPPLLIGPWDIVALDYRDNLALQRQLLAIHMAWTAGMEPRNQKVKELWAAGRFGGAMDHARYEAVHEAYSKPADAKQEAVIKANIVYVTELMDYTLRSFERTLPKRAACGGDSRCEKAVDYEECVNTKAKTAAMHPQFARAVVAGWAQVEPLVNELWARSTGMLERFHDPAWVELDRANLEAQIANYYRAHVDQIVGWTGIAKAVRESTCVPPPPPPPARATPDAKIPGVSSFRCPLPAVELSVTPWLSFEAQCFKVKVQAKSGPAGYMGYLAYDGLTSTTTVFAGAGAGESALLEGRGGVYVDFVGTEVTGLGFEAEVSSMLAGEAGASAQVRVDALAIAAGAPASEIFQTEVSSKLTVGG